MSLTYVIFKKINNNIQVIEKSSYSQFHYKMGCDATEYGELCELYRYAYNHHVSYNQIMNVYSKYPGDCEIESLYEPMLKTLDYDVIFNSNYLYFTIF